jgi:uncharacterized protein DUF5615
LNARHVPSAITDRLRRRGVDIVAALEGGFDHRPDAEVLGRSTQHNRLIFTQDIRFKARAEDWQRTGRRFAGLALGHQLGGTIGQYVEDLELIAVASVIAEWENVVEYLPFRCRQD